MKAEQQLKGMELQEKEKIYKKYIRKQFIKKPKTNVPINFRLKSI